MGTSKGIHRLGIFTGAILAGSFFLYVGYQPNPHLIAVLVVLPFIFALGYAVVRGVGWVLDGFEHDRKSE